MLTRAASAALGCLFLSHLHQLTRWRSFYMIRSSSSFSYLHQIPG